MKKVVVLAVLVAVAVAGCGTSGNASSSAPAVSSSEQAVTSSTSSAPTSISKAQAGQTYLADIGPANAALNALVAHAHTWTDATTSTQAAADVQPVTPALDKLRNQLLSLAQQYPAAASDIKSLVTAYTPLEGDLQLLATVNAFSVSSWLQQFARDASNTKAAAAIVRSDLGLPPAP